MLEELAGNVLVDAAVLSQFESNVQHVQRVEGHPSSGISLLESTTTRERFRAVENTDVIQTEKTTLENVVSVRVLAVDPPTIMSLGL